MNKLIEEGIEELYEKWLLDEYPHRINGKDDLIDKSCEGFKRDEFDELVREAL